VQHIRKRFARREVREDLVKQLAEGGRDDNLGERDPCGGLLQQRSNHRKRSARREVRGNHHEWPSIRSGLSEDRKISRGFTVDEIDARRDKFEQDRRSFPGIVGTESPFRARAKGS
jgi:hypothetical protein